MVLHLAGLQWKRHCVLSAYAKKPEALRYPGEFLDYLGHAPMLLGWAQQPTDEDQESWAKLVIPRQNPGLRRCHYYESPKLYRLYPGRSQAWPREALGTSFPGTRRWVHTQVLLQPSYYHPGCGHVSPRWQHGALLGPNHGQFFNTLRRCVDQVVSWQDLPEHYFLTPRHATLGKVTNLATFSLDFSMFKNQTLVAFK